jgi:hypothetical protein
MAQQATRGGFTLTKPAFDRDGILNLDERLASARKCVSLLDSHVNEMTQGETAFFRSMTQETKRVNGIVSERQLAWLRDLVSKYDA